MIFRSESDATVLPFPASETRGCRHNCTAPSLSHTAEASSATTRIAKWASNFGAGGLAALACRGRWMRRSSHFLAQGLPLFVAAWHSSRFISRRFSLLHHDGISQTWMGAGHVLAFFEGHGAPHLLWCNGHSQHTAPGLFQILFSSARFGVISSLATMPGVYRLSRRARNLLPLASAH